MWGGGAQIDGSGSDLSGKQPGHITFTAFPAGPKVARIFHDGDIIVGGVGQGPKSNVVRQNPLWGEGDVVRVVIVVNGREIDVPETAGFQTVFLGNQLRNDRGHVSGKILPVNRNTWLQVSRNSQSGHTQDRGFTSSCRGAGIKQVDSQVGSGINARNDEIRSFIS